MSFSSDMNSATLSIISKLSNAKLRNWICSGNIKASANKIKEADFLKPASLKDCPVFGWSRLQAILDFKTFPDMGFRRCWTKSNWVRSVQCSSLGLTPIVSCAIYTQNSHLVPNQKLLNVKSLANDVPRKRSVKGKIFQKRDQALFIPRSC